MSEHTPGPWRIAHNTRLEIVPERRDENGNIVNVVNQIAHVYRKGRAYGVSYNMPAEANARLIAAAPDLLAAAACSLPILLDYKNDIEHRTHIPLPDDSRLVMAIKTIYTALAKAEGKE